ncbi:MAG: voltage-gated potassium channel protein, partial [Proteobacteria bacterium]|nr:voltage-gated potassium channel protein [Pseudomonadota bacterium]
MPLHYASRLRVVLLRLGQAVHAQLWFPQTPLAALLAFGGLWLLQVDLGARWRPFVADLLSGQPAITPAVLPPLVVGTGMLIMALGLLLRSRVAWVMALLLAATAVFSMLLGQHRGGHWQLGYFVLLLALLLLAWRRFDHASIAAGTLFAISSVVMLLLYATLGTYYLGADFKPPVVDLVTALYYAVATMSTVGYGDIIPQTSEAKLFAVSVIMLGVAVFATSLTSVIVPTLSRSLQRIVNHKGPRMKRENHFVVVGNSPLATNTWRELAKRGQPVTRLLHQSVQGDALKNVDVVVGDPGSADVLREAGADKATAVLAMLDDDSENAFVVLATRELGGSARTVAAVNDAAHLGRVRLAQPDMVIAPQVLGGELAARLMCGEEVTLDLVMQQVFQNPK